MIQQNMKCYNNTQGWGSNKSLGPSVEMSVFNLTTK